MRALFNKNSVSKSLETEFLRMLEDNKSSFYKIAYSYVKNESDALEAVQESVCKAYTSLGKLKEKEYMKTWFTRIIINTSIDMTGKNKKIISFEEEVSKDKESSSSLENEVTDNLDLKEALDKLNENEKAIIKLRFFEDMKFEDISRVLEQPINTVKTIHYRALKKLRIDLEEVEISG